MTKIISLPDNMEYDPNSREAYLQYKSDCWRNVAIALKESIDNIDSTSIKTAVDMFETVKKMFPYMEA